MITIFPWSRSPDNHLKISCIFTILFPILIVVIVIKNGIALAQSPPDVLAPPSGFKIVNGQETHPEPAPIPHTKPTPTFQSGPQPNLNPDPIDKPEPQNIRDAGPFYELRTTIEDKELNNLPILRSCGATKKVRIDLVATNRFTATFFSNSEQVGNSYGFRRHWFSGKHWVGGARISERRCSIGVVVGGGQQSKSDYEVHLIDTSTGIQLSLDGINYYPKLHKTGGIIYVEPRIWFSPDDTVVLIIAAASEALWPNKTENIIAHFLDATSGETIERIRFEWPQKSVSLTPYGAEIDNSNGDSQILFSLEGNVISQIVVP